MQRLRFMIALAFLMGGLTASVVFVSKPWRASQLHDRFFATRGAGDYQKQRRGFARRLASQAAPGRIWFIGHSHVESLDVTRVDPRGLNLGIGGETLDGLHERLTDYPALSTAAAIVIVTGTNDIATSTAEKMTTKARNILHALPQEVPVLWSLILPVDLQAQTNLSTAKIQAVNGQWRSLCTHRAKCHVSDPLAVLANDKGQLRSDYHEGDGVHLNASGLARWRAQLQADLGTLLPASP